MSTSTFQVPTVDFQIGLSTIFTNMNMTRGKVLPKTKIDVSNQTTSFGNKRNQSMFLTLE